MKTYAQKEAEKKAAMMDQYSAPAEFASSAGHELTKDEKYVIESKGTEPAGTGKYDKFYPTEGYFACRKCGNPIYSHQAKFDSGCGSVLSPIELKSPEVCTPNPRVCARVVRM